MAGNNRKKGSSQKKTNQKNNAKSSAKKRVKKTAPKTKKHQYIKKDNVLQKKCQHQRAVIRCLQC